MFTQQEQLSNGELANIDVAIWYKASYLL